MRIAFWTWGVLLTASIALGTYSFYFDTNQSLSHVLGLALAQVVLFMLVLKLCIPLINYMDSRNHEFTQKEVAGILAEAKRSGKL